MEIFYIIIIGLIICLLVRPIIKGAIYFPTQEYNLEKIISLADMQKGRMVDLGSGDGRVVIAFAKKGIEAHGFEINPILVLISKWWIRKKGLQKKAFVHWKSFWREDLSKFDLIYVYGFYHIMNSLGKKLERELKPGKKIISNIYRFNNLKKINDKSPYLYVR